MWRAFRRVGRQSISFGGAVLDSGRRFCRRPPCEQIRRNILEADYPTMSRFPNVGAPLVRRTDHDKRRPIKRVCPTFALRIAARVHANTAHRLLEGFGAADAFALQGNRAHCE